MINKFQQGGQAQGSILAQIQQLPEDQQKQILQAFSQWAQQKGIDIKQLQQDPNALEQALGQFIQEMQQSAKHGAKLNYIKSLKHQCAEDEELYYFKKGGSLGCGCRKKEDGGEVQKAQDGVVADFKKKQQSKKPNPYASESEKKFLDARDKYRLNQQKKEEAYQKRIKQYNKIYSEDSADTSGQEYPISERGKKPQIQKKACGSKVVKDFKAKCGKKMKKHQNGGSLNGTPFIKVELQKGKENLGD